MNQGRTGQTWKEKQQKKTEIERTTFRMSMQTKARNEEKEIDTLLQTRNTSLIRTGNILDP